MSPLFFNVQLEIPGHRGTVRSCWIGIAALQGLLQCQVLSCPGEEGECQRISVSKPPLVHSALLFSLVFPEFEKLVVWRGKKNLEDKL